MLRARRDVAGFPKPVGQYEYYGSGKHLCGVAHVRFSWLWGLWCSTVARLGRTRANYGNAIEAWGVFHQLMDRGEFGAIYDTAANGFQASLNRDVAVGFLSRVSRKMGKCDTATVGLAAYRTSLAGTFVTTRASRGCTNGKIEEQFVWTMNRGKATLFGYNANSPALLTD